MSSLSSHPNYLVVAARQHTWFLGSLAADWTANFLRCAPLAESVAASNNGFLLVRGRRLYFGDSRLVRPLVFPRPVIMVAAGDRHLLLLTSQGECYGLGSNAVGALGIEQERAPAWHHLYSQVKKIHAYGSYSALITDDQQLYWTGTRHTPTLEQANSWTWLADQVQTVTLDQHHLLYLTNHNQVWKNGQLVSQTSQAIWQQVIQFQTWVVGLTIDGQVRVIAGLQSTGLEDIPVLVRELAVYQQILVALDRETYLWSWSTVNQDYTGWRSVSEVV